MAGYSDYTATAIHNWETGQLAFPAVPAVYFALFTTAPTSDAGTGGTEVSGGSYARVQVAGTATTNGTTAAGNATLHFASTPAWIVAGMSVRDVTASTVIPAATTVLSTTGTTVVMSANATGAGVGGTDVIIFSAFTPPAASVGTEPSVTPVTTTNTGAIITFAQATASWGTAQAWGAYDSLTSGNLLRWDYLGNYKWLPFSASAASPSVITSPAHGYSLTGTGGAADVLVVTTKFGGTLPTLSAGSFNPTLLVAATVATDTFTLTTSGATALNASTTGDGMIRKIVLQPIAINVTPSFAAGTMVLTTA